MYAVTQIPTIELWIQSKNQKKVTSLYPQIVLEISKELQVEILEVSQPTEFRT